MNHCCHCNQEIESSDKYCRECGKSTAPSPLRSTTIPWKYTTHIYILVFIIFISIGYPVLGQEDYGKNAGMWHQVGKLFNREQQRQRKMKHSSADQVENGPKEISIFCPQDPTIRITDLNEEERDRDECLVLNIAAPDVSSRLVLFCNAHPLDNDGKEEEEVEDDDEAEKGKGSTSDEL